MVGYSGRARATGSFGCRFARSCGSTRRYRIHRNDWTYRIDWTHWNHGTHCADWTDRNNRTDWADWPDGNYRTYRIYGTHCAYGAYGFHRTY